MAEFDRQIFLINFGYRALLDWSPSGEWSRNMGIAGTGSIAGPKYFAGAKRPRRNFWGQKGTSAYIRGFTGFYYDVYNPVPSANFNPKLEAGKDMMSQNPDELTKDIIEELNVNSQQWLYLAAEAMYARGKKLISSKRVKEEEIERILSLTTVGELQDEFMYEATDIERGAGKSAITSKGVYRTERSKAREAGVTSFGRLGKTKVRPGLMETYNNTNTIGEQQFRTMLKGVKGQWITAFAENVMGQAGEGAIRTLAGVVEKHIETHAKEYGLKEGETMKDIYGDYEYGTEGGRGKVRNEYEDASGQAVQEFAPIRAGAATAPKIPSQSLSIDLTWNEAVTLNGQNAGTRMDVTTEFFRKGLHHGIGTTGEGFAMKGKLETEKDVAEHYNTNRIPQYNELMRIILKATGSGRVRAGPKGAARLKEARETIGKGGSGPGGKKSVKEVAQQLKELDKTILSKAQQGIVEAASGQLAADLTWVLHHMGNLLPGKSGTETYTNMMPIKILGPDKKNPGPFTATLFVVFDLLENGMYHPMAPQGSSFVYIEDIEPMRWLYRQAGGKTLGMTYDQFTDMGSAAIFEAGIDGTLKSGQLHRLYGERQVAKQRLYMSKVSAPDMAKRLKAVTDKLFETIVTDTESKLNAKIKKDAVKYSVFQRNPSQLAQVKKWYDFAVDYLMTKDAAADAANAGDAGLKASEWEDFGVSKESRTDPFWYLWAAPYVTRSRPRIGGAVTGRVGR